MDGSVFYFAGGALVLIAVVFSAIGIRKHETFPPSKGVMVGVIAIFVVGVVAATTTAVVNAREEQDHRRHELAAESAEAEEAVDTGEEQAAAPGEPPAAPEKGAAPQGAAAPAGGGQQTLNVTSPEDGSLMFIPDGLAAKAGTVTLAYANPSPVPHSIAIEAEGGDVVEESDTITDGDTEISAELGPGDYNFFCTVPGHRESGMEGTLTVEP